MKRRSQSWTKLLTLHGASFLHWAAAEEVQWRCFSSLADSWDRLLQHYLAEPKYCATFMHALPKVLVHCNQDIYEEPAVVLAYSHVYLLERYRRFWEVPVELVRLNALPLGDRGVQVLDVGTGPAPVLYAVSDFYDAICAYAEVRGVPDLLNSRAELHALEASPTMTWLMHNISEFDRRERGPYAARYRDFDAFDPEDERSKARARELSRLVDIEEMSELEARRLMSQSAPDIDGSHRFLLCTFSNFLTREDVVHRQRARIVAAFQSLRPGGIAVVVCQRRFNSDPLAPVEN